MKMTLAQARLLMFLFGVLAIVLLPLGCILKSEALLYVGLIGFCLAVLVRLLFNRCPHCRKQLKQHTGLRCPYCGEKL